ncbi:hypothetical protein HaLaN_02234, partial [Haematococcus lacustris]
MASARNDPEGAGANPFWGLDAVDNNTGSRDVTYTGRHAAGATNHGSLPNTIRIAMRLCMLTKRRHLTRHCHASQDDEDGVVSA